jgi:hypothetical protein
MADEQVAVGERRHLAMPGVVDQLVDAVAAPGRFER